MKIDRNFFVKQKFTPEELVRYKQAAHRDFDIARASPEPEVMFHFGYMSLLKIGIYCLAKEGLRVKARPGHHQKIIESLADLLGNEEIHILGDRMRKDRNVDLYSAGQVASVDHINEYLKLIERLFRKI